LDVWATRNILMDTLAKQHLTFPQAAPRHFLIQGEPWQVWVGDRKLTSRIQARIYSFVHDEDGYQYWKAKNDSSAPAVDLVDWKSIGHAMRGVKRGRKVFVTKHVAGMCGVGKFMKRWGQWNVDRCPCCGEPEDARHVWLCKAPGARDVWTKSIDSIELKLRQLHTEPTLRHTIIHYLSGWQSGVSGTYNPPRVLMAALQEQNSIGWHRFFEGWLSTKWMEVQQRYYYTTKSSKNRNEVLHEKENQVTRSMGLHLNRRVTRVFFDLCSRPLRTNDNHLVRLLSKLLKRTVHYKTQWLTVAEPALREVRRQVWQDNTMATCLVAGMQRCMRSWLFKPGSR
jgi:hypothetical protein